MSLLILIVILVVAALFIKFGAGFLTASNKVNSMIILGYLLITIIGFFSLYIIGEYRGDISHSKGIVQQLSNEDHSKLVLDIAKSKKNISDVKSLVKMKDVSLPVKSNLGNVIHTESYFVSFDIISKEKPVEDGKIDIHLYSEILKFGDNDFTNKIAVPKFEMKNNVLKFGTDRSNSFHTNSSTPYTINGIVFGDDGIANQILKPNSDSNYDSIRPPRYIIYIEIPKGVKLVGGMGDMIYKIGEEIKQIG